MLIPASTAAIKLPLLVNCESNGWHATHFPEKMSCRGFVAFSLTCCLKDLGFPTYWAKRVRNECSRVAQRCSYLLYLRRSIREWTLDLLGSSANSWSSSTFFTLHFTLSQHWPVSRQIFSRSGPPLPQKRHKCGSHLLLIWSYCPGDFSRFSVFTDDLAVPYSLIRKGVIDAKNDIPIKTSSFLFLWSWAWDICSQNASWFPDQGLGSLFSLVVSMKCLFSSTCGGLEYLNSWDINFILGMRVDSPIKTPSLYFSEHELEMFE